MPGGSSRLGINTGRCRKAAQRASPFRERLATQDSSPTRPPPRGKGSNFKGSSDKDVQARLTGQRTAALTDAFPLDDTNTQRLWPGVDAGTMKVPSITTGSIPPQEATSAPRVRRL